MPKRRRVEVELLLEVARYLGPAKNVAAATKAVEGAVEDLGDEINRTSADLAEMAKNTDRAASEVDEFGDDARGTAADLAILDARIAATKANVRQLGLEFARTGAELSGGALNRERSLLGQLERLRGELGDLEESLTVDVSIGGPGATGFASRLRGFLGGLLPGGGGPGGFAIDPTALMAGLKPALVGLGLLAAPAIGAAVGGAIVGGVGLGGIVGGIAAAAKDQRVESAWFDFVSGLTPSAFGADAFVEPTIDALETLQREIGNLGLADILGQGADAVPILTRGLTSFVRGVLPGFDAAMGKSRQASLIFADGLGDIGTALGNSLVTMAESEGTLEGLRMALTLTAGAIQGTGATVGWLADRFHDLARVNANVWGALEDMPSLFQGEAAFWNDYWEGILGGGEGTVKTFGKVNEATRIMHSGMDDASKGAALFAYYLKNATGAAGAMGAQLGTLFQKELSLKDAQIAWAQSLIDVREQVKQTGTALDMNTSKGLANNAMIQDQIQRALALRDATLTMTGSVSGANQVFNDQLQVLKRLLLELGFNKEAVDRLIGTYTLTIVTEYKTKGSQPKWPGAITNTMNTSWVANEIGPKNRAAGGPAIPGMPYIINERGYETVTFNAGGAGQVHPAHLTPAWTAAPQQQQGGRVQVEVLVRAAPGSDSGVMRSIVDGLQYEVVRGGYRDVLELTERRR